MSNVPEKQILNIDLSNPKDVGKYQDLMPLFLIMESKGFKELSVSENEASMLAVAGRKYTFELSGDENDFTYTLKDVTNDN